MKTKVVDNNQSHSVNSSVDSENSQGSANNNEKQRSVEEIRKVKEKLEITNKTNLNKIFPDKDLFDWKQFYAKFMNGILQTKNITAKEIELRINYILNEYSSKRDKLENKEKSKNNLQLKNKYEFHDKTKFVSTVMSKYNEYDADNSFDEICLAPKNITAKYSKDSRSSQDVIQNKYIVPSLKAPMEKQYGSISNKKTTKMTLSKDVLVKFKSGSSVSGLKLKELKDMPRNTIGFKVETNTRSSKIPDSKTFELSQINKNSNSFIYERVSDNIKTEPEYVKLFKNSNFIENLFINNPTFLLKENLDNLKHDIKAYEKELMNSDNIFKLPNLRELKHFFAYDTTVEGILIGKAMKKFNYKDKLDANKKKIDTIIKKIINS